MSNLLCVCLQTNIPFLMNLLKQEDFLGGAVTTDFILKRPDLFKVQRGQNRAQKLLQYLGNVMVNGPCTPLATGLKPSKDAPDAPEVRIWTRLIWNVFRSRVIVLAINLSTLSERLPQVNTAVIYLSRGLGGTKSRAKTSEQSRKFKIYSLDWASGTGTEFPRSRQRLVLVKLFSVLAMTDTVFSSNFLSTVFRFLSFLLQSRITISLLEVINCFSVVFKQLYFQQC